MRIVTPTTPCLWCRKTIDAYVIRAEDLPEQERQRQQREGYVVRGVGDLVPSVVALTVLGSAMSTCALVTAACRRRARSRLLVIWSMAFLEIPSKTAPKSPVPGCRCQHRIGLGDSEHRHLWPDIAESENQMSAWIIGQ